MLVEKDMIDEIELLMKDHKWEEAYDVKIHTILMVGPKNEAYLKKMVKCSKKCNYWTGSFAQPMSFFLKFTFREGNKEKIQTLLALNDSALQESKQLGDKHPTPQSPQSSENSMSGGEAHNTNEQPEIVSSDDKDTLTAQPPSIQSTATTTTQNKYTKRVDWDKLVRDFEDEEEKQLTGDAALNNFFQRLYSNSSDNTKRAMMKSFQESSGTVLSTNWDQVKDGKVEAKPPDGVDIKKMP